MAVWWQCELQPPFCTSYIEVMSLHQNHTETIERLGRSCFNHHPRTLLIPCLRHAIQGKAKHTIKREACKGCVALFLSRTLPLGSSRTIGRAHPSEPKHVPVLPWIPKKTKLNHNHEKYEASHHPLRAGAVEEMKLPFEQAEPISVIEIVDG